MPTLIEEKNALQALREQYNAKWDAYPTKTMPDGTEAKDIPANDIDELNKLQTAMGEKGISIDKMQKVEDAAAESKSGLIHSQTPNRPSMPTGQVEQKSLGEMFTDSMQFKSRSGAIVSPFLVGEKTDQNVAKDWLRPELKFMGQASANLGIAGFVQRDEYVFAARRPVQVFDTLPIEVANSSSFKYMLQTTRTNNASMAVAEGTAASESVEVWAEQTGIITACRAWIAISEEQLEDVEEAQGLVNNDLTLMMKQVIDDYLCGSNSATYGYGMRYISGASTQSFTGYSFLEGVRRAINTINHTAYGAATTGYFHPTTVMTGVDLAVTADGQFIFPMGLMQGNGQRRVWGINIVETAATGIVGTAAAGVGVVIDNAFVKIKMRKDVTLESTNAHSDYFTKNLTVLRGTARLGLKCTRPTAVVVCSNIP